MEIYATNDKEGKYYHERFYVDTCIGNNYQSEYFQFESSVHKWLSDITDGKVKSKEDVEAFNDLHEELVDDDDDFIYIHEFKVIE